ncbi:hypothetical protein [Glutamicibacter ardleyensis]|uniref:hypothetical protein n=1 Tax=Glutamicibacter ardleyensis TaxID=225894 RepID=UPI003FCF85CE
MELIFSVNDFIVGATSGDGLAKGIRNFIGPILLLVMGIVSITFLFRREMTQFLIFLVISIVVAIIFYAPDVIKNIAQGVEKGTGTKGSWK